MICAAIYYVTDQNEPSAPILIDIATGDDPRLIHEILGNEWLRRAYDDQNTTLESDDEADSPPSHIGLRREGEYGWGDIVVYSDDDWYSDEILCVTLPDSHKSMIDAICRG